MNLRLFYRRAGDRVADLEQFLVDSGYTIPESEIFFVDDHRDRYDHNDPDQHPSKTQGAGGSCFCELPDYTDPVWPKLYNGFDYIASGDAIRAVDFSTIK